MAIQSIDQARGERCLSSVRRQIALARTLFDELEDIVPSSRLVSPPSGQMIEELTRLGCRILEAAAVLAEREESAREPCLAKCSQVQTESQSAVAGSLEVAQASMDSVA